MPNAWAIVTGMRMLTAVFWGSLGLALAVGAPAAEQAPAEGDDDDGVQLDLDALEAPEKDGGSEGNADTPAREPSSPPAGQASSGTPNKLVVAYGVNASEVPQGEQDRLRTLAESLKQSKARLTIVAYASGGDKRSANAAQRLALERAINLRHLLVAAGVDGARINLKPRGGAEAEAAPGDRAEVIIEGG